MTHQTFYIGNMDCAGCAREVEDGVLKLARVRSARVDFATSKLWLEGEVDFDTLKGRIESLGKTIVPASNAPLPAPSKGGIGGFWAYLLANHATRFALWGAMWMLIGGVATLLWGAVPFIGAIYALAMVTALYPIAKSGINNFLINRTFGINLLMTVAGIGAIAIGEYLEGALVIFLFAIGEALEGYTADRARDSLRSLMALKPTQAYRLNGVHAELVPVEALHVGEMLLIKAGERVPMDGVVVAGNSTVNQAPITGESMPIEKQVGADVFAGSINGNGTLTIRVTRLVQDNTLSRIITLVEEAQSQRAPSQRLIDRFAHYYTPAVAVLALLVAVVPPMMWNAPFYSTATETGWLYRALTMLVIACPCALVISTPVTIISAITAGARHGILIKGGVHLESLGTVKAIAFDKTGTLTHGKPVLQAVYDIQGDENGLLALVASVESHSTHPLAQAILAVVQERHIAFMPAEAVQTLAGQGIVGNVRSSRVVVANHAYFDENYAHSSVLCDQIAQAERDGLTTMLVYDGAQVRGFLAVADALRSESPQVINTLSQMNMQTILCSGDNQNVAERIGKMLGMTDIRAELLPAQKVDVVRELQQTYGSVMMVGDGINDTPALATATVGIAMGGAGSAQALETADVVLLADDLKQLPFAIRLSRFARRLIIANVGLSLGMKGLFLAVAVSGGVSLWVAIFADVGMSLLVTLNGMRPLRMKSSA